MTGFSRLGDDLAHDVDGLGLQALQMRERRATGRHERCSEHSARAEDCIGDGSRRNPEYRGRLNRIPPATGAPAPGRL